MAELMIKCPSTGKYLSTGVQMDRASLKSSHFEGNQTRCPHCDEAHVWGSKDCYLLEEQSSER